MSALRHFRRSPPWRMIAILLLAFGVNVLAPAGYMIAPGHGGLPTIAVCPETHPLARAVAASSATPQAHDGMATDHAAVGHAVVDHAAMGHHAMSPDAMEPDAVGPDDDDYAPLTANDGHCALASAAKTALHSVDEALLAEEVAYAVLLGLRPIRPLALPAQPHLRPPLRGPPPAI